MSDHIRLSYERYLKPELSFETSIGIIGIGKHQYIGRIQNTSQDNYRNARGVFLDGGCKFISNIIESQNHNKKNVTMQGLYVKPQFTLGLYNENFYFENSSSITLERGQVFFGALIVDVGGQSALSNFIVVDYFLGVGFPFDNIDRNKRYSGTDHGSSHSHIDLSNRQFAYLKYRDLALQLGFKLGIIF